MNKRRLLNSLVTQEKPDVFPILAREPRQQNQISRNRIRRFAVASVLVVFPLGTAVFVHAQHFGTQEHEASDPGVRGGPPGAGDPIARLTVEQAFFDDGKMRFKKTEGVLDGLGPTFNGDSCGVCHSQPAIGGTSPSTNPQVKLAMTGKNKQPFFVTLFGPVLEARFKFVVGPNGRVDRDEPDGSVHDLFTIQGLTDAPAACVLAQQDFEEAREQNNLTLRIPTPTFGGGLIEAIDDATILGNMKAKWSEKQQLGIHGTPNRSGNDATFTRFGWKAQNKSLLMFSSEAYSVELGETNQMFPQKRGFFPNPPPAACVSTRALPEDQTNFTATTVVGVPSDDDAFSTFMRFLDQPTPSTDTPGGSKSIANGRQQFSNIGCDLCHTPSMKTGKSSFTGLSGVQANLFSDLLLHHMGSGLNDGIMQGNAGPDQFRTAPLWGVGQRIFFMHDGRATPANGGLLKAIEDHAGPGSEANQVISLFHALKGEQKQDLLNFLRSL